MPATSTPAAMATMTPSGWTETSRPSRNGCRTWASSCCTATTPPSMISATIGPLATSATSTATEPESRAPISGMNAPMKTSTPMASTNGTPSTAATTMMPRASVKATSTVARTNAVREVQATRPEESTCTREARGKIRTSQVQMRLPSARKKYVENSTMKKPARMWLRVVPTSVTRETILLLEVVTASWADCR